MQIAALIEARGQLTQLTLSGAVKQPNQYVSKIIGFGVKPNNFKPKCVALALHIDSSKT